MTSNLKKEELVEQGRELQHVLNRLTEQAELAVQESDPAARFLQATNQNSSSSFR